MRAFYGPGVGFTADFTHSRHGSKKMTNDKFLMTNKNITVTDFA